MLSYHKEYAVIPNVNCEKLVVVVTYNRMKFIDKWLRAYNNAEKFGTKIAVIHAFDGDKPHDEEKENILKHNPDFYIPIFNTPLRDFGALVMVCKKMIPLPAWEHIFWFTDDMLPMRRMFLKPFVEKLKKDKTGLVAQCYEPKTTTNAGGHIRTVAYATKRSVVDKFEFPKYDTFDFRCGHEFEFGRNHIMKQVLKLGYDVELAHSAPEADNYQHWTSFLDWMWDCHLLESWKEYWDIYEEQFKPVQRLEDVQGKIETILSIGECEKRTLIQDKVTFLIHSKSNNVFDLNICLDSIAVNFPKTLVYEIVIAFSGLETNEIKDKEKIISTYNNVKINTIALKGSFKESIVKEQMILMCNSEIYIMMDDSIKIEKCDWQKIVSSFINNKKSAILCVNNNPTKVKIENNIFVLPSLNDKFIICKKSILKEIDASWESYEILFKFGIGNFTSYKKFINWQEKNKTIIGNVPEESRIFDGINLKSGSFVIDKILNNNYIIEKIEQHLTSDITSVVRNIEKYENNFVLMNTILEKEIISQEQAVS